MKRQAKLMFFLLLLVLVLTGCGKNSSSEGKSESSFEEADTIEKLQEYMVGKSIGVVTGSMHEQVAQEHFHESEIKQFSKQSDMLAALKAKKIDSFVSNVYASKEMKKENPELFVSPVALSEFDCGYALNFNNTKMQQEINETIKHLKESGKYEEILYKWVDGPEEDWALPTEELTGENGVMRIATNANSVPFSMTVNGEVVGFDMEILYWAAYEHGYSMEVQIVDFAGLIAAVVAGKADVAAATMCITPERAEQVLFTDSYLQNGHNLNFLQGGKEEVGFWAGLKSSFDKNFVREDRWKMIASGVGITILISLCAIVLGSILGFIICMLRSVKNKVISTIAKVYIRILQGTPILVFLMILYYVAFGSVEVNAIWVAVIAFSMNFGAYAAEMLRTGIEGVDIGQTEAAYAMGVGKSTTFFKIIFPQAAKTILPVYKGEVISLVKSTSIVGYVAIEDLTKVSDIIRSRTYEAFFPLIATAIIYFAISYLLMMLLNLVEIKIDPRHKKKGVA